MPNVDILLISTSMFCYAELLVIVVIILSALVLSSMMICGFWLYANRCAFYHAPWFCILFRRIRQALNNQQFVPSEYPCNDQAKRLKVT
jgi:hypothetical protein